MYESNKDNTKQKCFWLLFITGLILFGMYCLYYWMEHEKDKIYYAFDEARIEYRNNLAADSIYQQKDKDFVEKVYVYTSFDDDVYSNMIFQNNIDEVTVRMQDDIENCTVKERCAYFVKIMYEIQTNIDEYYRNSSYYKIFQDNKNNYSSMRYKGKSLEVSHTTEFTFNTSTNIYTFKYHNSMTQNNIKTGKATYYDYSSADGILENFKNKYGNNSRKTLTNNQNSTDTKKTTSKKKDYSDPYGVNDYNSSQEFADDKYDEFYDYEDDYDDEDDAYDAAEDYWNEHN